MAYSEAKIAEVFAILGANGGNVKDASDKSGVHRRTIDRWLKRSFPGGDVESVRRKSAHKTASLADSLERLAERLIREAMKEERIEDAKYYDLVGGFKVSIDQMRNLRGQGEGSRDGLAEFLAETEDDDVEEGQED